MNIQDIFLSINARNFDAQTAWWTIFIGRAPDRKPMPSCQEWDLTPSVLFQVLDSPDNGPTDVSLRIDDMDKEIARLRKVGVDVPDPQDVEGFDTLRWSAFTDPEGNKVNLLEGS
ncbi:VOC family protein [Roseovarius sp. Pro17]|uniref:VOC family protein n=1 Tax=Roseovarius sp. Pro17 TaxID=3108175 RepID=UPI002D78A8DC|nr:VOC family protein [Roseovarius sp. Pro17]